MLHSTFYVLWCALFAVLVGMVCWSWYFYLLSLFVCCFVFAVCLFGFVCICYLSFCCLFFLFSFFLFFFLIISYLYAECSCITVYYILCYLQCESLFVYRGLTWCANYSFLYFLFVYVY